MTQKKKMALYARVSMDNGTQHPEVQLSHLRDYCKRRGFRIFHEYIDQMSGAKEERPNFQKMMDDCRKRRVDGVLVFRFDRFARSVKVLVSALEEFKELGVDFISYSENIDTSTPMGKAMFVIISAFSAMEREIIKERVCAGLKVAKEKGIKLGRPRVGFDIGKALKLKQEGLGLRRIAKKLGVSYGTVYNYLKSVKNTSAEKLTLSVN